MQLDEFIKASLVQIANGVSEAGKELEGTGALVNPRNVAASGKETFNIYGYISESQTLSRCYESFRI